MSYKNCSKTYERLIVRPADNKHKLRMKEEHTYDKISSVGNQYEAVTTENQTSFVVTSVKGTLATQKHTCFDVTSENDTYGDLTTNKDVYEEVKAVENTYKNHTYSGVKLENHRNDDLTTSQDVYDEVKSLENNYTNHTYSDVTSENDINHDLTTSQDVYDEVQSVENIYEDVASGKPNCDKRRSPGHTYEDLSTEGGDRKYGSQVATFTISLIPTDYSKKLKLRKKSLYLLKCETKRLVLLEKSTSTELLSWTYNCIRRFHTEVRQHLYGFEAGRSSTYGTGTLKFKVKHDFESLVERIRFFVGL